MWTIDKLINKQIRPFNKHRPHFRAKRLPQHTVLVPRPGILLLSENIVFTQVNLAAFRTSEIPFDSILKTVRIISSRLPLQARMALQSSWDRTRQKLEKMERQSHLVEKMDFESFPRLQQREELPPLADILLEPLDEPVITGNVRDEAIEDGEIEEIEEGCDVVVYTNTMSKRPWVGRQGFISFHNL